MNTLRFRMRVLSVLSIVALAVTVALSGCGSSNSGGTNAQIPGKIYIIGKISGTLADEIEQLFLDRFDYDGVSTDAPIFVAASAVQSLGEDMKKGILNTYKEGRPIVVVHGTEAQNNALLAVLGLEQNYKLPKDKTYTELFAVDTEEDDHTFMWSMYPPREDIMQSSDGSVSEPSPYTDNDAHQLQRAGIFHEWISDDGERLTEVVMAHKVEAVKALSAAVRSESVNLTDLAQGYVKTVTFSDRGNNYQFHYYIYACHSFPAAGAADAAEYDWFYVRQEGVLSASAAYAGVKEWYNNLGHDEIHYYVGEYEMNNFMDVTSGVSLIKSEPQNANNVAQVTSGVDWNIGGTVGFQGGNATGSLNAGVTVKNSTSFNVSDCDVTNLSGSNGDNTMWRYTFKKPTQTPYMFYAKLSEPPILSRSNFQPVNQWIWKFDPSVRDSGWTYFTSVPVVRLAQTIGGSVVLWITAEDAKHNWFSRSEWVDVPLTYPPLLVVAHNIDFGAAAQYKSQDFNVARSWTASSDKTWCRIEPSSGTGANRRVNITVDKNETGASRTATVTFKTADGKSSDTMTVFQAQY